MPVPGYELGTQQWREKFPPSDGSSTTDIGREFQLYLSIRQELVYRRSEARTEHAAEFLFTTQLLLNERKEMSMGYNREKKTLRFRA